MNKLAVEHNLQGLAQVKEGRYDVAIRFFTMALDEDQEFLEAYKNRGEALIKLNRIEEGEEDLLKAEGERKKSQKTITKQKRVVEKYDMQGVEDLWSTVLPDDGSDDDLFLDDLLYDRDQSSAALGDEEIPDPDEYETEREDISDDEIYHADETVHAELSPDAEPIDEQIEEESVPLIHEPEFYSVMLEYIGGYRQKVTRARLFEPQENALLLIDEETDDEQVVFFDQLSCLYVSGLPVRISPKRKESSASEIITTTDGKIYHERVCSEQNIENILVCSSRDDQFAFAYTLFPKSIIEKRTQDKLLTDILLEKRFISESMLQKALSEFEQFKSITLEKIIAQKACITLAEIETALDEVKQFQMDGLSKEETLLISGLVNEEEILEAGEQLEEIQKLKIGEFLVEKGFVLEKEVYISLAEKHHLPFVDLKGQKLSKKSLAILPAAFIRNHEILPLALKDDTLLVATYFMDMTHLKDAISKAAGCKHVKYVISPPSQIRKITTLLFAKGM